MALEPIDQSGADEDEKRRQANAANLNQVQDTSTVGEQDGGAAKGIIGAIKNPGAIHTGIIGAINRVTGAGEQDTSLPLEMPAFSTGDSSGGSGGGESGGGSSSGGESSSGGGGDTGFRHGGVVPRTGHYKLHRGEMVIPSHMAKRFMEARR